MSSATSASSAKARPERRRWGLRARSMGADVTPRRASCEGGSADGRQRPAARRSAVEAEQEHALPGTETELGVVERNLLRLRAEQQANDSLTLGNLQRHEALEQVFEVLEETRLPLVDPHEAGRLG